MLQVVFGEDSVLSITSDKRCTAGIRDNVSNRAASDLQATE